MTVEDELRLLCVLTIEGVMEEKLAVIEQMPTNVMYLQETNTKEKSLDVFQISLDHLTAKNGSHYKNN